MANSTEQSSSRWRGNDLDIPDTCRERQVNVSRLWRPIFCVLWGWTSPSVHVWNSRWWSVKVNMSRQLDLLFGWHLALTIHANAMSTVCMTHDTGSCEQWVQSTCGFENKRLYRKIYKLTRSLFFNVHCFNNLACTYTPCLRKKMHRKIWQKLYQIFTDLQNLTTLSPNLPVQIFRHENYLSNC